MHQSFTGNARKTRQVNLSGRQTINPWTTAVGPTKANPFATNTQSTIAQAQVERLRRQNERDRLNSGRKLQRIWRGYTSRRLQKSLWRQEWDAIEQGRISSRESIPYSDIVKSESTVPGYTSSEVLLSQLRLFVHYQEYKGGVLRDLSDLERLLYFGRGINATFRSDLVIELNDSWRRNLSKLCLTIAKHIKSIVLTDHGCSPSSNISELLKDLVLVGNVVPEQMAIHAKQFMQVFQLLIERKPQYDVVGGILSILQSTGHTLAAFDAFIDEILSQNALSKSSEILRSLGKEVGLDMLALAIANQGQGLHPAQKTTFDVDKQLWKLAYLIYFQRTSLQVQSGSNTKSFRAWVNAISTLLSQCANDIAARLEVEDYAMAEDRSSTIQPLEPFIKENLLRLVEQQRVRDIITELSQWSLEQASTVNESAFIAAKELANYAVALLQAFPGKATNIRMWLYQGSIRSSAGTDLSTIQYFWATAQNTKVFGTILQSHRNVLSTLQEASPETNQIGRSPPTSVEVEKWRDEWRVLLLFLELYTFVLKLMDDDEFFALERSASFGTTQNHSGQIKRGALPLSDIATMTTFLKNLAFTLYWYAADLVETNEVEEATRISALFGNVAEEAVRTAEKTRPQLLAGNDVSQGYLKGLVTGLLRMLHERDSRRGFLPTNHWLMTSQVDMAGFIPAVVAEEEKRHELGDEEDQEELDGGIVSADPADNEAELASTGNLMRSMFGIREPHTPRSRTSRYAEILERQRKIARKKRQRESLAPRLEILRNLPFFIPFETRVQIFREFVYRDQLRRRDGYVDPDNWRMSIASNTQGRGLDGRPRGFDIISRHHAEIHRESVFEDAYSSFYDLGEGLKEPIQISFIDKFGAPEAGIDGGGVTKEFLMSITNEAFDPKSNLSMFQENDQHFLFPNPLIFDEIVEDLNRVGIKRGSENFSQQMREFLRRFEFLGRIIGKCLYEGILIDLSFAGFFLLKWALTGGTTSASNETAYRATINDMREFDEELYQGLLKLKNYSGDVETDFALNFTVSDTIRLTDDDGHETVLTTTKDLIPNGANIAVTNVNRLAYIDRIVRYRLQQQPQLVTNAFLRGLGQIIQPMWLAMFNQKELQKLVGGDNTELDIADLRRNTQYGGLYVIGDDGLEHPTVSLFWRALKEMSDEDRRKVLKFVTSTPRAPLLGFSHLNPKFSIRDSSEDQARLPSTSTCVNLLKLPRYGDIKTMREKLLYAINSGAGFDLS